MLDIDPPPYEETVDAYSRMAESLGIRDQAIVNVFWHFSYMAHGFDRICVGW